MSFTSKEIGLTDFPRQDRPPVLITKKGKPVAKLVPAEPASDDFLGKLSAVIKIVGDITQPIEDPDAWESAR